jgi:hypothetical protein
MYVFAQERRSYTKEGNLKRASFKIVTMGTYKDCLNRLKEEYELNKDYLDTTIHKWSNMIEIEYTLSSGTKTVKEFSIRNSKNELKELKGL